MRRSRGGRKSRKTKKAGQQAALLQPARHSRSRRVPPAPAPALARPALAHPALAHPAHRAPAPKKGFLNRMKEGLNAVHRKIMGPSKKVGGRKRGRKSRKRRCRSRRR
jgi:hypothetical protein